MAGLLDLLQMMQQTQPQGQAGGLLGDVPMPQPRPDSAPMDPRFSMPSGNSFSPQGFTGGPFNMPGMLANGSPAAMRSEGTGYEGARRELGHNPPFSILGSMLQPQQSALMDAIRAEIMKRQQQTGYNWQNPPTMTPPQQ